MNLKIRGIAVCALVVALGLAGWLVFRPRGEPAGQPGSADRGEVGQSEEGGADAEYVMVGGVRRKASDIQPVEPLAEPKVVDGELKERDPLDYGALPPIKADANPQVEAVVEAIQQKRHPERLSAMASPPPFDAKAYRSDPAAYLSVVELGRVFQTAQPGPGVPRLQAVSPNLQMVKQGESVKLKVIAPPGSPVSFTSFDCGEFDNRLTAITVTADEEGVAEARFTTTPGTIEDIHILAGSPQASGQVRFVVNVALAVAKHDAQAAGPEQGQP